MPLTLTGGLILFSHMMKYIFQEYMDQFIVVYLDNILIFLETREDHNEHVSLTITKLCECLCQIRGEFKIPFILSLLKASLWKMLTMIQAWDPPTLVKEVQSFLGFANFQFWVYPSPLTILLWFLQTSIMGLFKPI